MKIVFAILLFACATKPSIVVTPPATFVETTKTCTLPPVPNPPSIVGYPSPTTIYVTTSDLEAITRSALEASRWMEAVSRCLGSEH